ncbi:vWA domain-containing protein [Candidatus Venteria ishoeyi]|uniref:von Willebrand factor type A domain protein n=1 Tax=Candidatus Venteria ishoeyi TaxID=1899563 RepID=A0A1H6F6J2_9GAMM|nr:vWA domain-containing protein [Candidatus Venteria ishoeyi]SEH05750.1 von Willebrand factor type A domain protein [Candidatus Venteria ishoeyi]
MLRLILILILITHTHWAMAAKSGLNVVLIIDQSGSMYGYTDQRTGERIQTDPDGKRIYVVKKLIRYFAQRIQNTPLIHRISILEFGGNYKRGPDVNVIVSNCAISYNPGHPQSADQIAAPCITSNLTAKHMNNTNTPEAMRKALEEIKLLSAIEAGRQLKILLITDGRPDVKGSNGQYRNLEDLRSEIRGIDSQLDDLGVDFRVIGLKDKTNYWDEGKYGLSDGMFWNKITGKKTNGHYKAAVADSHYVLEKRIDDLIDDWLDEAGKFKLPCGETPTAEYEMRPYLDAVTFTVDFNKYGSALKVDYAGKQVALIRPATSRDTEARHTIQRPLPGTYHFKGQPDTDNDLFYCVAVTETLPKVKLMTPTVSVRKDEVAKIQFQVTQAGKEFMDIPSLPVTKHLQAEVTATSPSGSVKHFTLAEIKYENKGIFSIEWMPTEEGRHEFTFQGEISIPGKKTEKFIAENSAKNAGFIEVNPARTPLWLHLERPDTENGLKLTHFPLLTRFIPVKLSLYEEDEEVSLEQYVIGDKNTWLELQVVYSDTGRAVTGTESLPLTVNDEGYLETQIPMHILPFKTLNGDLWYRPGTVSIKINAIADRTPPQHKLAGIYLPPELVSNRVHGNIMSVSGIQVKTPIWLVLIMSLIPVVLLSILFWLTFWMLIPWLIIRNEDAKRGGKVTLLIYDSIEDSNAVTPLKKFIITGQRLVNLDGQISLMADPKPKVAEYCHLRRNPTNASSPNARLQYRWRDDDKIQTIILSNGQPRLLVDQYHIILKK